MVMVMVCHADIHCKKIYLFAAGPSYENFYGANKKDIAN